MRALKTMPNIISTFQNFIVSILSARKTKFIPVKIEFCSRISKFHFYSASIKMEDLQTFQNRQYQRASALKKPSLSRQIRLLLGIAPTILPKTLLLFVLLIISLLSYVFRLILPRRLKSIQGQLAAVCVNPINKHFTHYSIAFE